MIGPYTETSPGSIACRERYLAALRRLELHYPEATRPLSVMAIRLHLLQSIRAEGKPRR
jgi:hypothetical protein